MFVRTLRNVSRVKREPHRSFVIKSAHVYQRTLTGVSMKTFVLVSGRIHIYPNDEISTIVRSAICVLD